MKGSDLKVFRKVNNLTQEQLGDYLGIKKSFISQIESGKCAMPTDKFNKLINNPYGWVTEMITNDGDSSQIDMLDWMEFLRAK